MIDRTTESWILTAALCLLCGGCVPYLGKTAARPVDTSVPESFGASKDETNSARLAVSKFFRDPALVKLVEQALDNNQELNIVQQEIAIANSEIMARQGEYLPRLGIRTEAGIEKVGEFTSQGASDAANEIKPGRRVPQKLQSYGLGFAASWEVDIWNKLRNATKAAFYRYLATVEGKKFMITRLVAEIARSYFELEALDNQLDVLRRNIEIQTAALDVVRVQKQAARVTELAVQRFEAEVLRSRSRVFDVQQEIVQTENRINYLVGRFPQRVERNSQRFASLRPSDVATGVPTQLLENRPDLKRAEMGLAAAKLDVSVARARFYPSLSIEGSAGLEAFELNSLKALPESLFYNAFANVTAPLLNRKALTASYRVANSKQMQAVLTYEQTIRKAFAEAANQIAMIANLGGKYQLKQQQVDILRRAIDVSSQLFSSARADYMEVLLTRRDVLEAEMELIETKKRQMSAMVNMYQALGGGWREGAE
ncbi:MAG: efflux transporter outer membrane subunit [Planctomycetes bacterium]|nr:efflux transporter outer membrane subunit [Planctomycetota bacterium]MCB9870944.1 efflux transporter outer membrane subunit [Planctomycetota bacterium]MCB9888308.1 efflux transporter outer membrane subunit [Planctomycetota bacterium]